jgi:hypothetical protein
MAKAKKVREAKDCHLSEAQKEKVTRVVRELIGKGRAVEGIVRSSLSPKHGMYIWYGIDNGKVVSVTGFDSDKLTAEFKDESSWAVKEWRKLQFKRHRRQEKLAAKLAKQEAAKKAAQ